MFAQRVIGLRQGQIVYDGAPAGLTPEILTAIYGEEDWSQAIRREDEPEGEGLDEERMAGLR